MRLFTVGYSGKNEVKFFEILRKVGVSKIIDVRRFRTSKFVPFASEINLQKKCKHKYSIIKQVAPSCELLDCWQKGEIAWSFYEREYKKYLESIHAEKFFTKEFLSNACLLCMEEKPAQCHRRLLAEYLSEKFEDIEVIHL